MTPKRLTYLEDRNHFSVQTTTGFALENGTCALTTDRGKLYPLSMSGEGHGVTLRWTSRRLSTRAFEFSQQVRNLHRDPLDIFAIHMFDGQLGVLGDGWQVLHSELFCREHYFDGYTLLTDGLTAALSETQGVFGMSENFPFPAILFTHPERGTVLFGVTSQQRCKPRWTLRRRGRRLMLLAEDAFTGVPSIRVRQGRTFETERWLVLWNKADVNAVIDDYHRLIGSRMTFPGADSMLRHAVVWGSWNYNPRPLGFGDITHDWVVANARALKRLAPDKPRFAMIDDGYQQGLAECRTGKGWFASALDRFDPEDNTPPHDPIRFPQGLGATARAIRRAGCEPAIWTTPRLHRQSSLARRHPEWLLQTQDKRPFGTKTAYLDYSLSEVRAFIRNVWDTYCNEWGYKGVKLDFWSLPFEIPQVRYQNTHLTAIELRNLFLQDLRDCIPSGGYLLTGTVINFGNPFPGRYADAARIGADIGSGRVPNINRSAACLTVSAPFFRHDRFLGDADSIGWNAHYPENANRLWATLAMVAGGVLEIGGDLTRPSRDARAFYETIIRFHKPAQRVYSNVFGSGIARLPSQHWRLEREDGVYEAQFNWGGWPREIPETKPIRDVWTGRRIQDVDRMPPFSAMLYQRD